MRKEIIVLNILLVTLLGCSISTNSEINPTISPSSSIEVSTVATHSPTPLPVIEDKSLDPNFYCVNAYFKDNFDDEINNPKIDKPYDLSVSSDGKKVYITKYRDIDDCKTYGGNTSKTYIDREFIYKIEDNKVKILKLDDSYDYSKALYHHIEIDKDNNLYVIRSDVNKKPPYNLGLNISNQELLKITNEKDISKKITLKNEENIGYNYIIRQLNISKFDSNITYNQIPFRLELNKTINQINNNTINTLFIMTGYSGGYQIFLFENNELNFGNYSIKAPFPFTMNSLENSQIIDKLPNYPKFTHTIVSMKMNSKKEVFAIAKTVLYKGDNWEGLKDDNKIYKIVPDKGFEVFAGSTEAGYRDGLGGTAMFNNPSNIDFDANDNMYVADTGNNAIRKITPNGDVTTFFKQD